MAALSNRFFLVSGRTANSLIDRIEPSILLCAILGKHFGAKAASASHNSYLSVVAPSAFVPLPAIPIEVCTCMHTYIVVPSVCRAFRPLVPEVHRYKGRHGVEPWSLYLHTYIHTYTLLSGRRFFSCMTGDGNGNEDGDNPTHV